MQWNSSCSDTRLPSFKCCDFSNTIAKNHAAFLSPTTDNIDDAKYCR